MSKIKHITVTTTEQEITLGATYQFAWFRNNSDVDVIVSDHSGIVEDADDTEIIKSNDVGRITITNRDKVYAKAVSDTAKIDVHAQNFEGCPFKSGAKGGGSDSGANIYRTTTALTDGATTNPITVDGETVTAVSGDFAVYNTQEFLFDGTQWNLLGDRVGLGELAYLNQDDLGELAIKDADDIHREISDIEYGALPAAKKNDGTEYFVYETSEDNRTVTAYDSNGDFIYKLTPYGCSASSISLDSKTTTPPTITGPDAFGSGAFIFKGAFADGNTYYFSDSFTNDRTTYNFSNNSAHISDAYGSNLFFAINGNRFNLMSAPNVAWVSSLHISGYEESSFEYGAVETGKRYIKAYDKSYGIGGVTRTALYDSGSYSEDAPYQQDVNFLDNLSNYDFISVLISSIGDMASGTRVMQNWFIDVDIALAEPKMSYCVYKERAIHIAFSDTKFNITIRTAVGESSDYLPRVYKIYGYKFG